MSYVLLLAIVIVIVAIAYIFTALSGNEQNETAMSQGEDINSTANLLRPVESREEIISSCNSAAESGDVGMFCQKYRKVDIDGLGIFINCEADHISAEVANSLSCDGYSVSADQLCDMESLDNDEFILIDGQATTCAEARNLAQ